MTRYSFFRFPFWTLARCSYGTVSLKHLSEICEMMPVCKWQDRSCSSSVIKTHNRVPCGPRKSGMCTQCEYINTKSNVCMVLCLFVSLWSLIQTRPNLPCRCWHTRGEYEIRMKHIVPVIPEVWAFKNSLIYFSFFFFFIFVFFSHTWKKLPLNPNA